MNTEQIKQYIEEYIKVNPRYESYASVLQKVFEQVVKKCAPFAIVQTRAKTLGSFAEKIQRKKDKYHDPLRELTDLCGVRIITFLADEVKVVCKFIEDNFIIDWENSIDVSQRLKPSEFGYRSVHYIVQFKKGVFPNDDVAVEVSDTAYPDEQDPTSMKAEIQVRTILEHAWAVFNHERTYKSAFTIPGEWRRELAGVAAMLEEADKVFYRIKDRLQDYAANYGTYMTPEQIQDEISILEFVLKYEPDNLELVNRIGKLAITAGNWEKAVEILSPYEDSGDKSIMKNLGIALCKLYGDEAGYESAYLTGQQYLAEASAPQHRDPDALSSLAGTWKDVDDEKAKSLYRQACEIDPADPYPLQNYLLFEIAGRKDVSLVNLVTPTINAAIKRCRDYANIGINIPWVYFNMGNLLLLLNKPYESLATYAKGIACSPDDWMIETTLNFLKKLAVVKEQLAGYDWTCSLLALGLAARFQTTETLAQARNLISGKIEPIHKPVVIVAGDCKNNTPQPVSRYQEMLMEAFNAFTGTIISGGTTSGVSGMIGDIQKAFPQQVTTIGYLPEPLPQRISQDKRYRDLRITTGVDFSPYQPLYYWTEIIASGISPNQIKVLGIGGGKISAFEYRMALAFGASVAVIEGSGNEAAKLIADPDWGTAQNLFILPPDRMTLKAFIGSDASAFSQDVRESMGRTIHENYRLERTASGYSQDPTMANWDVLREDLKESNRQQADHIFEKLGQLGYTMQEVKDRTIKPITFTDQEVETMAEIEHGRWVVERLKEGWKRGKKKDATNRISPYLVSWAQLSDEVQGWDRQAVRKIPELLAKIGIEVTKK